MIKKSFVFGLALAAVLIPAGVLAGTITVPCPVEATTGAYDCSGKDLRGLSFRNLNLNGAKFVNAKIQNLDFSGASIKNTNWLGAYIDGDVSDGNYGPEKEYIMNMPRAKICNVLLPNGETVTRFQDCGKMPGN